MQFKYESASATVRPLEPFAGLLMNVRANTKGQGHGTELMRIVCAWADRKNMLLFLEVRVFETGGIPDNKRLAEWYEKFGFGKNAAQLRRNEMIRYPIAEKS